MKASKTIHSFLLSEQEGQTLLTAQEYPWSVLQVVVFDPKYFDWWVEVCKHHGMVATHEKDRSFCIIHLCSGDQNGKYPDRHVPMNTPKDTDRYLKALKEF